MVDQTFQLRLGIPKEFPRTREVRTSEALVFVEQRLRSTARLQLLLPQ
jgi:hypothetical protein